MEEIFKKLPIMDRKVEEEVPLVLIVMMTKSSTFEKKWFPRPRSKLVVKNLRKMKKKLEIPTQLKT